VCSTRWGNGINPRLELLGVVMTMFDGRTNLSPQVTEMCGIITEKKFLGRSFRARRLWRSASFGKADYSL